MSVFPRARDTPHTSTRSRGVHSTARARPRPATRHDIRDSTREGQRAGAREPPVHRQPVRLASARVRMWRGVTPRPARHGRRRVLRTRNGWAAAPYPRSHGRARSRQSRCRRARRARCSAYTTAANNSRHNVGAERGHHDCGVAEWCARAVPWLSNRSAPRRGSQRPEGRRRRGAGSSILACWCGRCGAAG